MMLRVLAVSSAIALAGAGAAVADAGARHKTVTIGVKDDFFSPATKTVKKGTKLKFVWNGKDLHNVIASGAATAHSKLQKTGTYSFTAAKKGTIKLVCEIHSEMTGTITVK
jgi:plastocyanin